MLVLLLTKSALAGTCATPQVLDAHGGLAEPPHAHALVAPPHLDGQPRRAPPGGGKVVYGTPYDNHFETENFTINWWSPDISVADAEAAAQALETAWDSFVAAGWTPPVSSDRYYLWVLLDPSLGGTTGYTAEYFTDEFPDGYPVIWLNPDYAWHGAFWASLSAHELMHAFQYALRDYDGAGGEAETWYWEASATWGSELADPDVDGHQYTSEWWATTADLTYTSTVSTRQYGLFVLNAWLDVEGIGPGTMLDVWQASATHPELLWADLLEEATGTPATDLWAGFTGAYVNGGLAESDRYTDIPPQGALSDGTTGRLPYLGTHAWRVEDDATVTATGDVLLGSAWGTGTQVQVRAGERLSVTGTADGQSDYSLALSAPDGGEDTGPDGDGGTDGGGTDGGGTDGGGTDGGSTDGGSGSPLGPPRDEAAGCGCGGGGFLAAPWIIPLLALGRRRRT